MQRFWIFLAVVLVLGAVPALYPSLWRGEGDWVLAQAELQAQTIGTLQQRLGHALDTEVLEQFADCITTDTIAWLRTSDCPYFVDALEEQAQCLHDAGLADASASIQLGCARRYSPKKWGPLRPLFVGDATKSLAETKLSTQERAALIECTGTQMVQTLDASSCRPVSIFEGATGCFHSKRRGDALRTALTTCSEILSLQ